VKAIARHTITVPASTEHLGAVRAEIAARARAFGFTETQVQDIQLAVDEAVTNVIKHAYKFDPSRTFQVMIDTQGRDFMVDIIDSGNSFDQEHYHEPDVSQRIKERKKGGVGVYLMRKLMDNVSYRSENGCNCMRLIKRR
jgi:serine/threonine-protein kinase RsbW